MTELSTSALEPLRKDAEFVLYRGRRDAGPSHILVVAPASEQPARRTLKRLEHEYALRTELDWAWAVRSHGAHVIALGDIGCGPALRLRPPDFLPDMRGPLQVQGRPSPGSPHWFSLSEKVESRVTIQEPRILVRKSAPAYASGTKSYSPMPCRIRKVAAVSPPLVTRCGRCGRTE